MSDWRNGGGALCGRIKAVSSIKLIFSPQIFPVTKDLFSVWDFEKSSALQSRRRQWEDGSDRPMKLELLLKQPPSAFVSALELNRPKQAQKVHKNGDREGKCTGGKKGERALRREGGHRTAQGLSSCTTSS